MNAKQMNVSERVKQVRKSLGLTQSRFATLLGVHPITVSQWEIGRRTMDAEMYRKVERVYKAMNGVTDIQKAVPLICNIEAKKDTWQREENYDQFEKLLKEAKAIGCNVADYDVEEFISNLKETQTENVQIISLTDVMKLLIGQRVSLNNSHEEGAYAEADEDDEIIMDGYIAASIAATMANKPYGLFWAYENGHSGIRISDQKLNEAKIVAQPSKDLKNRLQWLNLAKANGEQFEITLSLATVEDILL
jgi:transcriptional regulator with XRE-family HTH domain